MTEAHRSSHGFPRLENPESVALIGRAVDRIVGVTDRLDREEIAAVRNIDHEMTEDRLGFDTHEEIVTPGADLHVSVPTTEAIVEAGIVKRAKLPEIPFLRHCVVADRQRIRSIAINAPGPETQGHARPPR